MPKGRPRTCLEESERLEARRAKVRLNVQAFRRREKEKERVVREATTISTVASHENGQPPENRALVERLDLPFRISNIRHTTQPTKIELIGNSSDQNTNQQISSSPPDFPLGKFLKPVSQADFIMIALQHRYVPHGPISNALSYRPGARMGQLCSTWVTTERISNTPEGRLLRSALFATALGVVGLERHDTRLLASGFQAQSIAFHKVRHALDSLATGKAQLDIIMVAVTVMFCAFSELTINKSWENFWKHMHGIGALIERGGPSSLSSAAARDFLYGYRALQMPYGFMHRRAHFLAQPRWIDLEWRKSNMLNCDHMQTMLDIAYQIPVEMHDYDESHSHSPGDLLECIERLRALAVQLDEWEADVAMSCISTPYRTKSATWPGVFTGAIEFQDVTFAMPFSSSCGVRIHLFDLIRQIAEVLSEHDECHNSAQVIVRATISECLKWSRTACQCMEFFQMQESEMKIAERLISLFLFDAAWDTFSRFSKFYGMDLWQEVRWCQNVASNYDASGLSVLCWR